MSKYKIEVIQDECIGDKMCCNDAPNTFEMNEDDKATVINEDGDSVEAILDAAKNCPVDCIHLTDKETGQKVWPE